ncbi:MAG: hypothetical protein GXP38_05800 [Chloroflexi bacterium]|nr:hypothetical protein [Chloroflexota bacterium]
MSPKSPSTAYHQLHDVLNEHQGCPICHIGRHAGHTYLDSLLWESVNDPGMRAKLTHSIGLCQRHSLAMLSFPGERLGVAILQNAILQEALHQLQTNSPHPSSSSWLSRKLKGDVPQSSSGAADAPCPACQQERAAENRAIMTLIEYFFQDLEALLHTSGGLCRPHLLASLQQVPRNSKVGTALIELHVQLWQEVTQALQEFIRKKDYRFRDEPITDEERIAVDRSIAILTGENP